MGIRSERGGGWSSGMKRFDVCGGMTWHLKKNPVPPKAWGSGGEAPGSTTTFNIDMHMHIHLNIDCQFGI